MNAISGVGTLGLNLVNNGSIHDLAGNPLTEANAGASFQNQATFDSGQFAMAVADVNGDGIPDLVIADNPGGKYNGDNGVSCWATATAPSRVALTFATAIQATSQSPWRTSMATASPIWWSPTTPYSVALLLGNGNGTFQHPTLFANSTNPSSVTVADVNGDGNPDLIVANSTCGVSVLLGNGNGTFQKSGDFRHGPVPSFRGGLGRHRRRQPRHCSPELCR